MKIDSRTRSISKKLSNIVNERNTTYQNVLTEFFLERLLARLVLNSKLKSNLIFKGGYVGYKIYYSQRYTVDLDALLMNYDLLSCAMLIKESVKNDIDDHVWFEFESEANIRAQLEYGGYRMTFRAGIGIRPEKLNQCQIINLDIAIGDVIVSLPTLRETKLLLEEKSLSWFVYPVESMIAEKLHVIVARGAHNSRSKDIYDICLFFPQANSELLRSSIKLCFLSRETNVPNDISRFLSELDYSLLERGWISALSSTSKNITFRECIKMIIKYFRKLGDI